MGWQNLILKKVVRVETNSYIKLNLKQLNIISNFISKFSNTIRSSYAEKST